MSKLNYLNVGCGSKYHKDWTNIDMISDSKYVIAVNLLKGIPYPDNQFDVVYHSQVLEHIPKEDAPTFIKECFRVLKPGGIIRIVLPDLENLMQEYSRLLHENLTTPSEMSRANYEWILLEIFDQAVRHSPGGNMVKYLQDPEIINKEYIHDRLGYIGKLITTNKKITLKEKINQSMRSGSALKRLLKDAFNKFRRSGIVSQKRLVGAFRLGGEVHMWMYDRYSLSQLLYQCGFTNVKLMDPKTSDIKNWSDYELDVKNGDAYDPTSLFMEATKL